MEVQHHTHTERKKWHHYLWEFLMLFLAVFCGFLAESYREYRIEHHKEKQYMRSMIADLKKDTSEYADVIFRNTKRMNGLDSMLDKLNDSPLDATVLYYFLIKYSISYNLADPSQRTISQLKNAGGMRLIHQQDVSDSINNYDLSLNGLQTQQEAVVNNAHVARDIAEDIFDLNSIRSLKISGNAEKILQSGLHLQLITNDNKIIKRYSNRVYFYKGVIRNQNVFLSQEKAMAERLILYIREKYSLE
ncbi:MAG TPA: hypothetical protein VFU29_15095 [Chitinophagaceae bacterium]|nr:hypothetical protein [Chitinophagaceae bacterium]